MTRKDPNSPTDFYITVEGQEPKLFDPHDVAPNIIVHQGDVEDWIIENRTRNCMPSTSTKSISCLMEWNGVPIDEPFLRDTINVAYWDGNSPAISQRETAHGLPRSPASSERFVYHCHLLEHEDGGMMGMIQVVPRPIAESPQSSSLPQDPATYSNNMTCDY